MLTSILQLLKIPANKNVLHPNYCKNASFKAYAEFTLHVQYIQSNGYFLVTSNSSYNYNTTLYEYMLLESRVSDPDETRIQSGQWTRIQEDKNDPQK